MSNNKISLVIYTHTSQSFIYPVLIGQVHKYINDVNIHICYNHNAPQEIVNCFPESWKKHTYTDGILWTDRVYSLLQDIPEKYVLFIHEDWLPTGFVYYDVLSKVVDFMEEQKCGFMMSYSHKYFMETHPNGIYTSYPDYYYYYMGWHVFQPAIWKKSVLEEFCTTLRKNKSENEQGDCLDFMSTKNCWAVQNINTVTTLRTTNSLIFPHMHALTRDEWNFLKYKGVPELNLPSLKELIESYGIDTSTRRICQWWETDTQ